MHLRMTNQRECILKELQESQEHLTADELYDRVKKVMPRISLATVYRNLETLSAAGTINKLERSGRQKRFDYDASDHDHIYCIQCHRIDNIRLKSDSVQTPSPKLANGYRVTGFRLEFAGLCSACSGDR